MSMHRDNTMARAHITSISTRLGNNTLEKQEVYISRKVMNWCKFQADSEKKEDPLSSSNSLRLLDQALETTTPVITSHSVEEEGLKTLKMNRIWV